MPPPHSSRVRFRVADPFDVTLHARAVAVSAYNLPGLKRETVLFLVFLCLSLVTHIMASSVASLTHAFTHSLIVCCVELHVLRISRVAVLDERIALDLYGLRRTWCSALARARAGC